MAQPPHHICDTTVAAPQCWELEPRARAAADCSFIHRVVCISLREDAARRENLATMLTAMGITPTFKIVDRHPEGGRRGCFASHVEVAQEAARDGVRTLLVFEDDARAGRPLADVDLRELRAFCASPAMQEQDGLLLLGFLLWPGVTRITKLSGFERIKRATHAYTTHAYLLGARGIDTMANRMVWAGEHIDKVATGRGCKSMFVPYILTPILFYQCDCGTSVTPEMLPLQRLIGFKKLMDTHLWLAENTAAWATALSITLAVILTLAIAIPLARKK